MTRNRNSVLLNEEYPQRMSQVGKATNYLETREILDELTKHTFEILEPKVEIKKSER